MVSFTVRMRFDQQDLETVKEQLRQITAASRKEPGCVNYVAHLVEGEAATVLIYEQYTDEAALEVHRASEHFRQYAIGGFFQAMKERSVENLTALS